MSGFDATRRVLFNQDGSDLNRQIRTEITRIETEARQVRARGGNPAAELRPMVDQLKTAIEVGRFETIQQIAAIHGEARSEWETARDKRPDRELAQIRRAENRFKGMADDDVAALSLAFSQGETDLSAIEINEARARLRSNGAALDVLNQVAKERRTDMPWISQDAELSKLADYGDTLSGFTGDQILVDIADEGGERLRERYTLDDLIDFDGELDRPDTGDL